MLYVSLCKQYDGGERKHISFVVTAERCAIAKQGRHALNKLFFQLLRFANRDPALTFSYDHLDLLFLGNFNSTSARLFKNMFFLQAFLHRVLRCENG
jgi:hypothetical protein